MGVIAWSDDIIVKGDLSMGASVQPLWESLDFVILFPHLVFFDFFLFNFHKIIHVSSTGNFVFN